MPVIFSPDCIVEMEMSIKISFHICIFDLFNKSMVLKNDGDDILVQLIGKNIFSGPEPSPIRTLFQHSVKFPRQVVIRYHDHIH